MDDLPPWLREIITRSDWVVRSVQGVSALTGALGTLFGVQKDALPLIAISIFIIVVISVWMVVGAYLRRQRARPPVLPPSPRSSSSYLRGLLPFEREEPLLGRDRDVGQLLALLRTMEYRVGFLSGEAGAGKTSLLRARVFPELEKDNKRVLYVSRVGGDPLAAIRMEIDRKKFVAAEDSSEPTIELIEKLAKANGSPGSVFIILDQFEEFFIARRSRKSSEAFEGFLRKLISLRSDVRLLFALRKEFVDDLLDFGSTAANLGKWRLPLRNLDPEIARLVIGEVAKAENLPFSVELQDLVVTDLTQAQRVRPVEFQLVFTTLLNQRVHDRSSYEAIGGAKGVIARFIEEIIAPPEQTISEAERAVARHTLRALCDKDFTARRPTGLTREDLVGRIREELRTGTGAPIAPGEVEPALIRVLDRFFEAFVLIREDGERINLAHDYLASSIRDATANIETVEETATRLLEQLLQHDREFGGATIPWQKFRYILRYASRELIARTESKTLIRRTRRQQVAIGAGVAIVALVVSTTLLLPWGTHYPIRDTLPIAENKIVSSNGRVVLAFDDNSASIVRLNGEHPRGESLGVGGARAGALSPDGASALVLDKEGRLHQFWIGENLSGSLVINDLGWQRWFSSAPFGFSRDSKAAYAVARDGRIFTWYTSRAPHLVTRLTSLPGRGGGAVNTDKLPDPSAYWLRQPVSPEVYITPDGSKLAVIDGTGRLFLLPSTGTNMQPSEVATVEAKTKLLGDRASKWLVYGSGSEVAAIDLSEQRGTNPIILWKDRRIGATDNFVNFSMSGDGWLVWSASSENFYSVNLDAPGMPQLNSTFYSEQESTIYSSFTPVFGGKGMYAVVLGQDTRIYALRLPSLPFLTTKPLLINPINQIAAFCPTSAKLMISAGDGELYFKDLLLPETAQQVGRLAGANVTFRFTADGSDVIAYNEYRIAFGTCGGKMTIMPELPSRALEVEVDPEGYLIVLSENELARVDRAFLLWGLPIWRLGWPPLAARG